MAGFTSRDNNGLVARLNPDGAPDPGFNGGVPRSLGAPFHYEDLHAVAVQPDGRIVAAGEAFVGLNAAVYRLSADGTPDPSFSDDGAAFVDSAGREVAYGVALQPDGKVVVAGYTTVQTSAAVYRLNADGTMDTTFDLDGARGINLGGNEVAHAVAIQPDGRIVVAGWSTFNNDGDVLAARFLADGTPDPSFGGDDGVTLIETGIDDYAYALAIQPDGKIVMAGEAVNSEDYDASVYRLNLDGTPDTGFGGAGFIRLDEGADEEANALALQPDGKILVGGYTSAGVDGVIWRLLPHGLRDPAFGTDGAFVLAGGGLEEVEALALTPDGRIAVVGNG